MLTASLQSDTCLETEFISDSKSSLQSASVNLSARAVVSFHYIALSLHLPSASDPRVEASNLYDAIWQAGVILLPIKSVGVMGDERTYENPVALRAVVSTDAMTADWFHFPYDFLAQVSNDIINKVKGVNRVVYDISSKPPATIEWE